MDDAYSVQTTAAATADKDSLETLVTLKDADTFLVADAWGDVRSGADGLFHKDTRVLSRLTMTVGGVRPSRLSSGVTESNVFFTCHSTNRPLPPMGGRSAPAGVLHLERRRFLWESRLFERVRIVNHGMEDILLPLTYEYAADFADIFEVRGTPRAHRGQYLPPRMDGRRVTFGYMGLDGIQRTSCLAFSEPPARLNANRAEFMFSLPRGTSLNLYVECGAGTCDCPDAERWRANSVAALLGMRRRLRRGARVRSARNPRINDWLRQSRTDVALLTTDLPTGPYPYAGVPWFSTPFGRDGIITAWQMLWIDPSLASGVLRYLAGRQSTETNAFRDSAPGKIMHETRGGEMSALGEVPFENYYGGVDTTCLFIALAGAYVRRTGDLEMIRELWPNLMAAADWMLKHGDSNNDGLIVYARAADTGLSNQGWKDSEDSIFDSQGVFPAGPVALLEVQGYAFAAWQALGYLGSLLGDERANQWHDRAEQVRNLVEERFWMEDRGFYAIALDGHGDQMRAIGSNAGHLLFSGLPSPRRAHLVTQKMLTPDFRSGWGLRTLAKGQPRYNPMSYHNGSVWPHDTALAAAGMAHYGERATVAELLGEVFGAATHFQLRLPELFCGFEREPGEPPIAYPVACLPQAWAASSVFLMLQASLGISIDALTGRIEINRPELPVGLDQLSVTRLKIGEGTIDLHFHRLNGQVVVMPRDRRGKVSVHITTD